MSSKTLCDKTNMSKIEAVKEIRAALDFSLHDAKAMADAAEKFGSVRTIIGCKHAKTSLTVSTMQHDNYKPAIPGEPDDFAVYAYEESIS